MLSIENDVLAVGEDADRASRDVILLASELDDLSFFSVVVGHEGRAYIGFGDFKVAQLYEINRVNVCEVNL